MKPKAVDSTYIQSLQYFEESRVLRIRFSDGALIDYQNVSPRTYKAIVSADSHGQKFTELVKDKHNFVVVKAAT